MFCTGRAAPRAQPGRLGRRALLVALGGILSLLGGGCNSAAGPGDPTLVITTAELASGRRTVSYDETLTATGGDGEYRWWVGSGWLTNLSYLNLARDSNNDVSALMGLTALSTLNLSHNSISDISGFDRLTNLHALDLQSNSVSDIVDVQSECQ